MLHLRTLWNNVMNTTKYLIGHVVMGCCGGRRKPVHIVCQVLYCKLPTLITSDYQDFPLARILTLILEMGGECLTTETCDVSPLTFLPLMFFVSHLKALTEENAKKICKKGFTGSLR